MKEIDNLKRIEPILINHIRHFNPLKIKITFEKGELINSQAQSYEWKVRIKFKSKEYLIPIANLEPSDSVDKEKIETRQKIIDMIKKKNLTIRRHLIGYGLTAYL